MAHECFILSILLNNVELPALIQNLLLEKKNQNPSLRMVWMTCWQLIWRRYFKVIETFFTLLPFLIKGMSLHLKNLEFLYTVRAPCQICLKKVQLFRRRITLLNFTFYTRMLFSSTIKTGSVVLGKRMFKSRHCISCMSLLSSPFWNLVPYLSKLEPQGCFR